MREDRPSLLARLLRGLDGLRRFLAQRPLLRPARRPRGRRLRLPAPKVPGRRRARRQAAGRDRRAALRRRPGPAAGRRHGRRRVGGAARRCSRTSSTPSAAAKDDARIKALYLDLDDMSGAGLTKLRDLRAAIAEFRKSGKKVVAYSDGLMQTPYYLAAQADEVYLHPDGHGPARGLRALAQLLQGGPRPLRHRDARLPRGRVQVGGRALPAQRHVARGAGDGARHLRRPLARLPRGRGRGAQDPARGHHRD